MADDAPEMPKRLGGDGEDGSGELTREDILTLLGSYRTEAQEARRTGPASRDDVWKANWDLYWNNHDWSKKAPWQSQLAMPEAPAFVDRWSGAMREALMQDGRWFTVEDSGDPEGDLTEHVAKLLDYILSCSGRSPQGHKLAFDATFEDVMRCGAIMACSLSVTWKVDRHGGYVAIEPVDPRHVWVDHTGRGQYRMRRDEIDKHELLALARMTDSDDNPIYDIEAIESLAAEIDPEREEERERSSGHSQTQSSQRKPIIRDEYLANIVDYDGSIAYENALVVVVNEKHVIRGPEENPFWHKCDWIVFSPMMTIPFSVYGKSYMEDWSSVALAFTEMTNLILDASFTQAMNAYVTQPELLEDPTQLESGISPNKNFVLAEGEAVADFMKSIELGNLGSEPLNVWRSLKEALREGAKLNDIALGQIPPQGDITATQVAETSQSSSSVIRSIARTVETRVLEVMLQLAFSCAMQHMDFGDPAVIKALGKETCAMLDSRRAEFQQYPFVFRVRAISGLIDRQMKLRSLMTMLQIIGGNELLLQMFMKRFSADRLLSQLLKFLGIDTLALQATEREQTAEALAGGGQPPAGQGEAGTDGNPVSRVTGQGQART